MSGDMAAVWITIDKMDGSTRVVGPKYPDEVDLFGLLFKLNEGDFASVTFTRANPLNKMERKDAEVSSDPIPAKAANRAAVDTSCQ
jgi:hypothetical protein